MRPKIHYSPPKGWMNDPNGLIYMGGEYHLYYQYFPYGLKWGTMHWGHATTKNFLTYKTHDIALFPSILEDRNGAFSGSSIYVDNILNIFYTGVIYEKENPSNIHVPKKGYEFFSSQIKITSQDGYTFDNFEGKQIVLPVIKDETIGDPKHTRDPKVWKYDNKYYMILGTKVKDKQSNYQGKILIYESKDLEHFNLFSSSTLPGYGDMWECPDYFTLENSGYLIMSPENINLSNLTDTSNSLYASHATIQRATLDYNNQEFSFEEKFEFLDYGLDIYAPQTFEDEEGRRTLISWIRMPKEENDTDNKYIGMMTMPRIISQKDGQLNYEVHPKINESFKEVANVDLSEVSLLEFKMIKGDYLNIGNYKITFEDKILVDRSKCFVGNKNLILKSPQINKDEVDVKVYIDANVIEIFIDNGRYVITNIVYNLGNNIDTNIDTIYCKRLML